MGIGRVLELFGAMGLGQLLCALDRAEAYVKGKEQREQQYCGKDPLALVGKKGKMGMRATFFESFLQCVDQNGDAEEGAPIPMAVAGDRVVLVPGGYRKYAEEQQLHVAFGGTEPLLAAAQAEDASDQ